MTKEELKEYLKENLEIIVNEHEKMHDEGPFVDIEIHLEGEKIWVN